MGTSGGAGRNATGAVDPHPGRTATMATTPDSSHRPGHLRVATPAALAVIVFVPLVAAGGLITKPLNEAGLTVPVFAAMALLSLPALRGTRWWRNPAPLLLGLFWAVFWVWAPRALSVAPDQRLGRRELTGLAVCTCVSLTAVALSRGTRPGLVAFRWGWVLALLLTGGIGVWEILTGHHLWTPDWAPWRFNDYRVAASTFINPNNFGAALVSMLAGVIALLATAKNRWLRATLAVLAASAVTLILVTTSRAALVGVAVIVGLEGWRRWRLSPNRRVARSRQSRRRVLAWTVAAAAVAVATFLIPPIASRNPIRAMVEIALTPGQARADSLRINLVQFALGYLRDSGWLGTGAASFEPLLWRDPRWGDLPKTNAHNAFIELLSQYGVAVFAPYLALLVLLVAVMLRARHGAAVPAQADERVVVRNELAGQLTAFVMLGATASSALEIPFWWLSLSNAVAIAWYLRSGRRRQPR